MKSIFLIISSEVAIMTIQEKEFSCFKGNMCIRGKEIYDKDKEGLLKPVIISHGFTADMNRSYHYGVFLAELGYHAYIFDFCGGGYHTISDGSFNDYMTPLTEKDDLKTVIEYVKAQPDIDTESLILMGCSQGGFVSALCAADLQDEVHGLVLFYPALCIPDDARSGKMQRIRFDPDNIPAHIGTDQMRVCGSYASSVIHMNVFEEISRYRGNVLIVHGTDDQIVNYGYALVADEVYRKHDAHSTLKPIEGGAHGFAPEHDTIACAALKEWLLTL